MSGNVDDRLLERWTDSSRRQAEARRFLARQRFPEELEASAALERIAALFAELGPPGRLPRRVAANEPLRPHGA